MGRAVLTKTNSVVTPDEWRDTGIFRLTHWYAVIPIEGLGLARKFDLTQVDRTHVVFTTSDNRVRIDVDIENGPKFGDLGLFEDEDGKRQLVWSGDLREDDGEVPETPIEPPDGGGGGTQPPSTPPVYYYAIRRSSQGREFTESDFLAGASSNDNEWTIRGVSGGENIFWGVAVQDGRSAQIDVLITGTGGVNIPADTQFPISSSPFSIDGTMYDVYASTFAIDNGAIGATLTVTLVGS